jgi:hypothetical protein
MDLLRRGNDAGPRICAIAGFLLFLGALFRPGSWPDFSDFAVFYQAGGKALAHRTVYDVAGHYQFKYAPWTAIVLGAFYSWLPFFWASLAHYLGIAALTLAAMRFVSRRAGFVDAPPLRAIGWGLLVFGVSIRDEWKLGQINLVVLGLLWPAFLAGSDSKRIKWGALALAHAILFKLYACIAIPWFVFRKEWRLLRWTGGFFLFFFWGAPALFHGPLFATAECGRWLQSLFHSTDELMLSSYNVSLHGWVGRFAGREVASFVAGMAGVGFLWKTWREAARRDVNGTLLHRLVLSGNSGFGIDNRASLRN